jgi:hypothetical protein
MNLEIQKDSTYTFTYTKVNKNLPVNISTATIEITEANGDEVLASTSMTVTDNIASYAWDSTDIDVGCNYIAKMTIDSDIIPRFFDIYYYPFQNLVIDNDLFKEDKHLKADSWEISGKADSGTTSTLVDANIQEADDYYNGGIIELYYDDQLEVRQITDYDSATRTITFSPVVSTAVSADLGYSARKSYQDLIDIAGEQVQERFQQMEKRAYLLIDHSQMNRCIIYKALALWYKDKRKEIEDEYDLKFQYYTESLETYISTTIWKYDRDYSGAIDQEQEDATTSRISWHR